MNACDNISGLSRELVLLAISFTAEDLRLFRTGLCQRGGALRSSGKCFRSTLLVRSREIPRPVFPADGLEPVMFRLLFGEI
jgi:hypothetical protein